MPDIWYDVDTALAEVPVNLMPLIDDTDFKTREVAIAYDAAGMDLRWNFVTTAGAYTSTAVTPTTGGDYDWAHQGDGMYSIEITASGGASINNDTEGFGWFTGVATGVLPWRGPVCGFRASGLNDALIDSAYSTTRGLAGTALPAAAADAAGGLPISDAGGLDLDAIKAKTDNLPSDPADASVIAGRFDTLDTAVADVPTVAEFNARTLAAADYFVVGDYTAPDNAGIAAAEASAADLQARVPAALTAGGNMKADALAVSGSTDAADRLESGALTTVVGVCDTGGNTTTVIASSLTTSAVNDQFIGRLIVFHTDTTTAGLRGQATAITDYVHATLTFTVDDLTTSPASGDTFVVV